MNHDRSETFEGDAEIAPFGSDDESTSLLENVLTDIETLDDRQPLISDELISNYPEKVRSTCRKFIAEAFHVLFSGFTAYTFYNPGADFPNRFTFLSKEASDVLGPFFGTGAFVAAFCLIYYAWHTLFKNIKSKTEGVKKLVFLVIGVLTVFPIWVTGNFADQSQDEKKHLVNMLVSAFPSLAMGGVYAEALVSALNNLFVPYQEFHEDLQHELILKKIIHELRKTSNTEILQLFLNTDEPGDIKKLIKYFKKAERSPEKINAILKAAKALNVDTSIKKIGTCKNAGLSGLTWCASLLAGIGLFGASLNGFKLINNKSPLVYFFGALSVIPIFSRAALLRRPVNKLLYKNTVFVKKSKVISPINICLLLLSITTAFFASGAGTNVVLFGMNDYVGSYFTYALASLTFILTMVLTEDVVFKFEDDLVHNVQSLFSDKYKLIEGIKKDFSGYEYSEIKGALDSI